MDCIKRIFKPAFDVAKVIEKDGSSQGDPELHVSKPHPHALDDCRKKMDEKHYELCHILFSTTRASHLSGLCLCRVWVILGIVVNCVDWDCELHSSWELMAGHLNTVCHYPSWQNTRDTGAHPKGFFKPQPSGRCNCPTCAKFYFLNRVNVERISVAKF